MSTRGASCPGGAYEMLTLQSYVVTARSLPGFVKTATILDGLTLGVDVLFLDAGGYQGLCALCGRGR